MGKQQSKAQHQKQMQQKQAADRKAAAEKQAAKQAKATARYRPQEEQPSITGNRKKGSWA